MQNCLFVLRKMETENDAKTQSNSSLLSLNDKSVEERIETLKNFLSSTLDKPNIETFIVALNKDMTLWGQTKEQQAYLERL